MDRVGARSAALALAGFALLGPPAPVTGQSAPEPQAMLLTIPSESVSFMLGGVIVSLETGDPIAGAQVLFAGTRAGTLTDRRGRFRLDWPAGGSMRLTVRLIGYREVCYNVDLLPGAMQSIGIRLPMSRLPPNQVDPTGCRDPEIDPRSPP
ncbi:MAG: carboxypeptidase-like regulatory domain-containing protein [Gemmatimonadota bacterium]